LIGASSAPIVEVTDRAAGDAEVHNPWSCLFTQFTQLI
jgi:hypothetical protein